MSQLHGLLQPFAILFIIAVIISLRYWPSKKATQLERNEAFKHIVTVTALTTTIVLLLLIDTMM